MMLPLCTNTPMVATGLCTAAEGMSSPQHLQPAERHTPAGLLLSGCFPRGPRSVAVPLTSLCAGRGEHGVLGSAGSACRRGVQMPLLALVQVTGPSTQPG